MAINREFFFDHVRQALFSGSMSQGQVDGLDAILDHWESDGGGSKDDRWLAYALATAYHETAKTIGPIREIGLGHGRPYGVPDPVTGQTYYGRGLVQLTWKKNYQAFSDILKVDLVGNPDLALGLNTLFPSCLLEWSGASSQEKSFWTTLMENWLIGSTRAGSSMG